jgi:uncharacterized protein (TIGR03083 family)
MAPAGDSSGKKTILLQQIDAARADLEIAIARLDDDQLTRPSKGGSWSIRDQLVHLAWWMRYALAALQNRPGFKAVGIDIDTWAASDNDAMNEVFLSRSCDASVAEVVSEFQQTQRQVRDALDALPADDLRRLYDTGPPNNPTPLYDVLYHEIAEHQRAHLDDIRAIADAMK